MAGWQPTAYNQYQWIVADPQLLTGVVPQLSAAGQQATDVGADLDVVFPQWLLMQHGVIREHFVHLQRRDANTARYFLDELVRNVAQFILRVKQHGDHGRALSSRRIALQELVKPGFQL